MGRKWKTAATSAKQGLTVMMNNAMNNNKLLKLKGVKGNCDSKEKPRERKRGKLRIEGRRLEL